MQKTVTFTKKMQMKYYMGFFQTAIKRVATSCSSQFANIDDHVRSREWLH